MAREHSLLERIAVGFQRHPDDRRHRERRAVQTERLDINLGYVEHPADDFFQAHRGSADALADLPHLRWVGRAGLHGIRHDVGIAAYLRQRRAKLV